MLKKIVLISHVPCSSGTYITHWICKILKAKYWLLPETNPHTLGNYNSSDSFYHNPGFALYAQKTINYEQWEKIYSFHLRDIINEWKNDEKVPYLVIRNWLFPEYFSKSSECKVSGANGTFSLLNIISRYHSDIVSVMTHRDPVDSWLGFNASFPQHSHKFTVKEYSLRYLKILSDLEKYKGNKNFIDLKLEDLVKSSSVRANLLVCLGVDQGKVELLSQSIDPQKLSSGASGRKYLTIAIPTRRPISIYGFLEMNKSKDLKHLRKKLAYHEKIKFRFFPFLLNSVIALVLRTLYLILPLPTFCSLSRKFGRLGICTF